MRQFDLDLVPVQQVVCEDKDRMPVKGNENRMIRVAFDLFHLKGDEQEDLWQVQADDDGEFLVRTYSLPDDEVVVSDWSVKEDTKQANLTIAYKGIPIQRVDGAGFGAKTPADVRILRQAMLKKLATDDEFVSHFFNDLPELKQSLLKEAGFQVRATNYNVQNTLMPVALDLAKAVGGKARKTAENDLVVEIGEKVVFSVSEDSWNIHVDDSIHDIFQRIMSMNLHGLLLGGMFETTEDDYSLEDTVDNENKCNETLTDLAALELELILKEATTRLSPDIELPLELQFKEKSEEETESSEDLSEEDKKILEEILGK